MALIYDEVVADKLPNLDLIQLKFLVSIGKEDAKEKLLKEVKENNMAPFYTSLCEEFKWPIDHQLLIEMNSDNEKQLKELQDKLEDAETNFGDNEVREALLARAKYFCQIGSKQQALKAFRITYEKTVPLGQRLDVLFSNIKIGFFFDDKDLIRRNIEKSYSLLEEGGDWDRKNRLKVFDAMYNLTLRNFPKAANLFLETMSTFTSYELFDYNKFVFYAVITSIISLDRTQLKHKVVDSADILSVIEYLPNLNYLLNSFYSSDYLKFFQSLYSITEELKEDWMLAPHAEYFCREMRVRAYAQLLESYRSVQLDSMAKAFGVSVEFLDKELARFIAGGRLHCKIDKVAGIVETVRRDSKNAQYQATIKRGDLLLNRIQKLSRVINL